MSSNSSMVYAMRLKKKALPSAMYGTMNGGYADTFREIRFPPAC